MSSSFQFARDLRTYRWLLSVATFVLTTGGPAAISLPSVQGGKAEPIRIQFQRGRNSATLNGEYAFNALKNQRLTLRLSAAPTNSVTVVARTPVGVDLPLHQDSSHISSVVLAENGEYELWVKRVTGTSGRSRYRLTVTIR
jgi:hypothetical protein